MASAPENIWECPLCSRRVPATVGVCRCGLSRDRAEPSRPVGAARRRISPAIPKAARTLLVAISALGIAASGATAVMVLLATREPAPVRSQKIRVLSRLDDFTRKAGPKVRNSIPDFLATPGSLGILKGDSVAGRTTVGIKRLSEAELVKGVCSPNVAMLIRYLYPASYDGWPDAKLEKTVLAKYPQYRGKLCILPLWIEAAPHDIVKYELTPDLPAAVHP